MGEKHFIVHLGMQLIMYLLFACSAVTLYETLPVHSASHQRITLKKEAVFMQCAVKVPLLSVFDIQTNVLQ